MKSATIIIPTWNGEPYLRAVLEAIAGQDYEGEVETLVIDSGSTAGTLAILAEFPWVRVEHIDKADFGHGRTRNLGASLASGHFVAFLTQDAIPADANWLQRLVEPLDINSDIWGVFGKQIPRPQCPPLQKYEIQGVFGSAGIDLGITLQGAEWASADAIDRAAFYSDVNAATRRSILVTELPYRDVPYGEDQFFGRDVLARGKLKAYAPRAAVVHSNDITLRDFAHRIFDEGLALRHAGSPVAVGRLPRRLARVARGSVADSRRIMRDGAYTWRDRVRWLTLNPRYHWAKWRGYRWAEVVDMSDASAVERYSLEAKHAST